MKFRNYFDYELDMKEPIEHYRAGLQGGAYSRPGMIDLSDGYYASGYKLSDVKINEDDVINNNEPAWVTHICWLKKENNNG